jgi:hypothetical protein
MHLAGRRFTAYLRGERDRAGKQIFPLRMGIILDDFEPDLLRANPHKGKLAYPVRLGAPRSGPYRRGDATRAWKWTYTSAENWVFTLRTHGTGLAKWTYTSTNKWIFTIRQTIVFLSNSGNDGP